MKPGRNRGFSGVGADVIAWELHLAGCKDIPAPRTIERIVARAGLTGRARPRRTHKDPRPYPAPTARQAGDVQQSDIVGPRHIATRKGPLRLFSYSTVDVLSLIHISEPTRRTPISYAVFCLKKKKPKTT